jgi:hypothetical protein
LLPPTAVCCDDALLTELVDDEELDESEPEPEVVVWVEPVVPVEPVEPVDDEVAEEPVVEVEPVEVLPVPVEVVPVEAPDVVVDELAVALSWATPATRPTTRATAPATVPEPIMAARRRSRWAGRVAFMAATIAPGASGRPQSSVKPVLTPHVPRLWPVRARSAAA